MGLNKIIKSIAFLGLVLFVFAGCENTTTNVNNNGTENVQEKVSFDGSQIDAIDNLASSVTLSKVVSSDKLGVKAMCPSGNDWKCEAKDNGVISMTWKDGMVSILITEDKVGRDLKEYYESTIMSDLYKKTNKQVDEKIEDNSMKALVKYGATEGSEKGNMRYFKVAKIGDKNILCSGTTNFNIDDFEKVKAEISAVCDSLEKK